MNSEKIYGIIGAMDIEVALIKDAMTVERQIDKAGMNFCEGTLGGKKLVVVKCGVGKVNAAICVQILKDDFDITHVINTGIAGSLDNRLDISDLVVSDNAVYHDFDVSLFGYKRGQVPGLDVHFFPADSELKERLVSACKQADPTHKLLLGTIASGDRFVSDSGIKDEIKKEFDALCCEMEGCAIAHAAYLNGIPFCILRKISDKADGSALEDYPSFEKKAAHACSEIIIYMMNHMD